jgi:hypothetical protein
MGDRQKRKCMTLFKNEKKRKWGTDKNEKTFHPSTKLKN